MHERTHPYSDSQDHYEVDDDDGNIRRVVDGDERLVLLAAADHGEAEIIPGHRGRAEPSELVILYNSSSQ